MLLLKGNDCFFFFDSKQSRLQFNPTHAVEHLPAEPGLATTGNISAYFPIIHVGHILR